MNEKLLLNTLSQEKYKIDKEERREIVLELLKKYTQRGLAKELGIPKSTIQDWATLRQNNTLKNIHISFNTFYRKISSLEPKDIKDWGRLQMINERIETLLRDKDRK